jgi:hypothetical protein
MRTEKVVMINAIDLFGGDDYYTNVNWQYCQSRSTFVHRCCCEFAIHVGSDIDDPDSTFNCVVREMIVFGCTQEFIDLYREAAFSGAVYVFFAA